MPALHALCCGRLAFDRSVFFPDAPPGTPTTVPVPCWLIRHPKGNLLFDTGIACDAASDPLAKLGRRIASTYKLVGAANENPVDQLALLGLAPDDITWVVNSHLHFDHCGCNASFPKATFLVQRAEMAAAQAPGSPYDARLWNHPLNYQTVDGEHDVFGDGSVMLLPTPGHTIGHQSLVVQVARDSRFVMTADACYSREHMERELLPHVLWNGPQMLDSMRRLRSLGEQSGTRVLYGHDPEQFATLGPPARALT
ncbi:MAG TPA: N-acyl homoserine lactonase family protein [Burkholderiaceae bacterium]|nr:N-acyl homoserine lactonase family protein [Burkholderiaceae bacterium]